MKSCYVVCSGFCLKMMLLVACSNLFKWSRAVDKPARATRVPDSKALGAGIFLDQASIDHALHWQWSRVFSLTQHSEKRTRFFSERKDSYRF